MTRVPSILVGIVFCCLAAAPSTAPTVGMEGRVQIHLSGTLLNAKPVDDKAPLILRVASATVGPNGGFYDLRYIGLEPGNHDLKDYLVREDGSALGELQAIPVSISPLLPEDHNGQLSKYAASRWPFFGGYRAALIGIVGLWVLLLIPIMMAGRKRRLAASAVAQVRPVTFADRLRPFIERAASGSLSSQDKSVLERLLLTHWQRRLGLTDMNPSEAIVALRSDATAGELLRTLENWLHRPPGASSPQVDVTELLRPYQDVQEPLEFAAAAAGGGV